MNLRYLLGALVSIPLLPIMYHQGKRIRTKVPQLPEASGTSGYCQITEGTAGNFQLLIIGESTIAGVGVETHEEGFAGTVARQLSDLLAVNVQWNVYARSGYTARNVAQRLVPKIAEKQADLIIIGLGGNDAFTLNRPRRWRKQIRTLIRGLNSRYPDVPIVFCNMPPIKEFPAFTPLIRFVLGNLVEILGKELQKVAAQYEQVFYVEEKITLSGWIDKLQPPVSKADFFSDGVHPSKLTYQTWAGEVARHISGNELIAARLNRRAYYLSGSPD